MMAETTHMHPSTMIRMRRAVRAERMEMAFMVLLFCDRRTDQPFNLFRYTRSTRSMDASSMSKTMPSILERM